MREKECFRDWLVELHGAFGDDTVFIPVSKVAKYLKKDYRTLMADKSFPVKRIGGRCEVPIVGLARWLS